MNKTDPANQMRGYRNEVRLHGLQGLQPAAAGLVFVEAVSNRPSHNGRMRPKHRHRTLNYSYFQAEGSSIGSGTIEATVKQIGARLKLSGVRWKAENVSQVLLHRCSYRDGQCSK